MPTVYTADALYQIAKAEIQSRNPALSDWSPGSVLDAIAAGGAMLADEVVRVQIDLFAALYLDTANGPDLDALALDRFGLVRIQANAAVGTLRVNRGASTGAVTIPLGQVVSGTVGSTSVSVATTAAAVIASSEAYVDVAAQASETGPGGNVAEDVLVTLSPILVDDPGAYVTNPDRFVGGSETETDAAFRDRIRRYFSTLRRATVSALETAALSVGGVQYVTVDETTAPAEAGGYVSVFVGDPDGRGNAELASMVQAEIENWRAAGVFVQVFAAEREEIPLAVTVYVRRGVDTATLLDLVRAAILAYTDGLAPSQALYFSAVEAAAISVLPGTIVGANADTSPSTTAESVSPTATRNALRVASTDLDVVFVESA